MLVEAIAKPVHYTWPGGEVRLLPGQPVDLPEDRALRLLAKAPSKVRRASLRPFPPSRTSWLVAWEWAADAVYGVTIEDPRLPGIMEALQRCDAAFEQDDWPAFQRATEAVRQAVQEGG